MNRCKTFPVLLPLLCTLLPWSASREAGGTGLFQHRTQETGGRSSMYQRSRQIGGALCMENFRTVITLAKNKPVFHYHCALTMLDNASDKIPFAGG